jgi:phage-related minor tail protein
MAEAYKGLTSIVEANLLRRSMRSRRATSRSRRRWRLSKQSEAALITKSTQLLTDALTQQTTLRRQATTDTLKLIDDESKARVSGSAARVRRKKSAAPTSTRVENEILATKRQTMTQALAEYRQHIDALNAEANRHLAEISASRRRSASSR